MMLAALLSQTKEAPMKLLTTDDLRALTPLVADAPHDLAVAAIAAHDAAGRAYADEPRHARLALVSPHWGRLYVLGRPEAESVAALHELLLDVVRPAAQANGAVFFTLMFPPDWAPHVPRLLEGMRAAPDERQYYRWSGEPLTPGAVPAGFTLVAADAALLARDDVVRLELLTEEMVSERASVEDFLAHSFGIAALHGNELAGWCLSEYNSGGRCEVGIATLEPFQRRGLATAMGRAFLEMARTHRVTEVGWHCWTKNRPSALAALKIGLTHVADYDVYVGWYNEADAPR
jgi:RimJ/RimL family protein N-acetyltransferase